MRRQAHHLLTEVRKYIYTRNADFFEMEKEVNVSLVCKINFDEIYTRMTGVSQVMDSTPRRNENKIEYNRKMSHPIQWLFTWNVVSLSLHGLSDRDLSGLQ